ncbi:MAG: GNAT family N-acetyltransferase [Alphaproteobacteria bacterium]
MSQPNRPTIPQRIDDGIDADYSDSRGDDFEALSRDTVPTRSMTADDLHSLVRIDRRLTGRDRTPYFERKLAEAIDESGIRVSLVAEMDDSVVGFIMARVDYGAFGRTEPEAVIDSIGVDPGYAHHHVGHALMSQLLANLAALRAERVRTVVNWDHFELLAFLAHCGFKPAQRLSFTKYVE